MRNALIKGLLDAAKKDKKIFFLTGDLGYNVIEPFAAKFPKQFLNVGVAEANLLTVAAGMATAGYKPFVYSIATFATMRAFEQIRNDVALQNLPITIIGVGGGLAYGTEGPTHHSLEDIALMRLLPTMTIINPCEPQEVYSAVMQLTTYQRPTYLRLERNPAFSIHKSVNFRIGKAEVIKRGATVALLATGTKTALAVEVYEKLLREQRKAITVAAFPTVNPLDTLFLKRLMKTHPIIITLEEHYSMGGFGTSVLEFLNENINGNNTVIRLGLKNAFTPFSASYERLMEYNGLTAAHIAKKISKFL